VRGTSRKVDYEALAELRYHIRRFLRVREEAARAAGIEPQQYLLLLQVKGRGSHGPVTVGILAERLQTRHHATVQLIDRLVDRGMVRRRRVESDRRGVQIELTPRGETVLRRLAMQSLTELRSEGPALAAAITRLIGRRRRRRAGLRATAPRAAR
jgi:DNA-binding MarR family transcriptional regulator